jgi:RNA polymerase sigma-70 factor, ECF subfamily
VGSEHEKHLLNRVRRGEREACEELLRSHYRAVYGLLAHLCRDGHLAEDLTQETFAAAWTSLGAFAGRSSVKTWLSRIAYRKFLDARRRGLMTAEKAREYQQTYLLHIDDHAVDDPLVAAEGRRRLFDVVNQLNDDDRTVITLHYLHDLSYREMATVLGRPSGTVKWQTSLALKRLRARLSDKVEV